MAVVDAHLHLFKAHSEDYPRLVFEGMVPAEREELAEEFLGAMDSAGVDHAVVVPLSAHDRYLAEILVDFPGRFAGVGVYDDSAEVGATQVARRAEEAGIQGLRFYGFGAEPGQAAESMDVFPVLEAMRDLDMKVWFYGSPDQVELLDEAMRLLPGLKVVLNHLGFCPDIWMELAIDEYMRPRFDIPLPPDSLELIERVAANHPDDLYVHISGQYAFTQTPYPHPDMQEVVDRIYRAFGAHRMLNASDWPWIKVQPGHGEVLALVDHLLPDITPEERAAIRGGTALSLFSF
ncbi:MAG: amidohydrolase family protein [bacterium]|nr:amidohydrolase family protein [bacterium]MDE0289631.1 amidohydrolase family protein [bacterium]MDE0437046.1 amidohydrolase family protein [bacterium]